MIESAAHRDQNAASIGQRGPLAANAERIGRSENADPGLSGWLSLAVDQVDYGLLLVDDDREIVHLNRVAQAELDEHHPLQLLGRELRARHAQDMAHLYDALSAASRRGLQRLLTLGIGEHRVSIVVVPLDPQRLASPGLTLLMMGKRDTCESLSLHWYAVSHHLTAAEALVLKGLCDGLTATQIAHHRGVKLSTIRTQITMIRTKTGTDKIVSLVRQVGMLPPLVSPLRGML